MPLHEHFHVSVTSCQRAEVKRVLHCDATTSADMDALLSKNFLLPGYMLPNNYKFIVPKFFRQSRLLQPAREEIFRYSLKL